MPLEVSCPWQKIATLLRINMLLTCACSSLCSFSRRARSVQLPYLGVAETKKESLRARSAVSSADGEPDRASRAADRRHPLLLRPAGAPRHPTERRVAPGGGHRARSAGHPDFRLREAVRPAVP